MANHCWNHAVFSGSVENITKLCNRLSYLRDEYIKTEYTNEGKEVPAYINENYLQFYSENFPKLFQKKKKWGDDVYEKFGSRWFECSWILEDDGTLTLSGDSAWSPVLLFFEQICKHYDLKAYGNYDEPGIDYAGEFEMENSGITQHDQMSSRQYQATNNPNSYWEDTIILIEDGHFDSLEDIFVDFRKSGWILSDTEKRQVTEEWENFQKSTQNED